MVMDLVRAQAYIIPDAQFPPKSFDDILDVTENQIPAELDGAMCGGWNENERIGPSAANGDLDISSNRTLTLIPFVSGAPGHRFVWDGAPETGMAVRDDTFVYPPNATGKTHVCDEETTEVTRRVWRDPVIEIIVPPPPPPGSSGSSASSVSSFDSSDGKIIILPPPTKFPPFPDFPPFPEPPLPPDMPQFPDSPFSAQLFPPSGTSSSALSGKRIFIVHEPGRYEDIVVPNPYFTDNPPCLWGPNGEESGPWTPGKCANFCSWLNTYAYPDCRFFEGVFDDDGNRIATKCTDTGMRKKYTCSEDWVDPDPVTNMAPLENCRVCTGDECRCPRPADDDSGGVASCPFVPSQTEVTTGDNPQAGREEKDAYASFYREYAVRAERTMLQDIPTDQLADFEATAACYAYYDQFDTATELTDGRFQCVIRFPFSKNDNNQWAMSPIGLRASQTGKGRYLAASADQAPITRNADFDPDEDLWYPNLGGGISFSTENSFSLLNLDKAQMESSFQVTVQDPQAPSYLRTADDTGLQTITKWWNKFMADALKLISPPAVRLRIGLGLTPILNDLPGAQAGAIVRDPRTDRVDAQLRASDDLLGVISDALSRFLLLKMEPIPVVVADGSPAYFRGMAQKWEDYKRQRIALLTITGQPSSLAVPQGVDELIATLQDYAVNIERSRALRSTLPNFLSQLLQRQRQILLGINEWTTDNVGRYRIFLQNREARVAMAQKVRDLQTLHASFRDRTTLPWCHREEFLPTIASLFDMSATGQPWLPGRPELTGGIQECDGDDGLPLLCMPDEEPDLILDLTNFVMKTKGQIVTVPQIVYKQIDVPMPPPAGDPPPDPAAIKMPQLKPVPDFNAEIPDYIPTVEVRDAPSTTVPEPELFDPEDSERQLQRAAQFLRSMTDAYDRFWNDREPGEATVGLECPGWNTSPCSYAEPELLQTFTRFASMPDVLTADHFDLLNVREEEACDPADEACLTMRPQKQWPRDGWQVVGPSNDETLEESIVNGMRTFTRTQLIDDEGLMQTDADGTPYFRDDPQILYPIYSRIRSVPLSPGL